MYSKELSKAADDLQQWCDVMTDDWITAFSHRCTSFRYLHLLCLTNRQYNLQTTPEVM